MSCDAICSISEYLHTQRPLSVTVTAKNLIQVLKLGVSYLRICLKGETSCDLALEMAINSWVRAVDIHVTEPARNEKKKKNKKKPARNGRMAADFLENTLLRLVREVKNRIVRDFHALCCNGTLIEYLLIDDIVMYWLDPLLEILKNLIHSDDPNLPKEQIKNLEEKLVFLRNFLEITGNELETMNNITPRQGLLHNKTSEDLLTRLKFLIENAVHLFYMSWLKPGRLDIDKLISDLLVKINHIEPEIRMIYVQLKGASKTANAGTLGIDLRALDSVEFLLGNLEVMLKDQDDGSNIPLDAHQLAFLQRELSFLKYFLVDPNLKQYIKSKPENFSSLLVQVEAMATEAASLTRSICVGQKKDEMHKEMNLVHSNLLEIVSLLKAEIRQIYPRVLKPTTSNFPQILKLGFLDFFIQNLDELLKHGADSIAYVKNEIETVQSELTLLRSSIGDTIKNPDKDENIAGRVVDVAYEAEHVIDLISASHFPRWYYILWLSDVTEKIKILRKESTEVFRMKKCNISELNLEKAPIHDGPLPYSLAPEDESVGFNDQAEKIIDRLTRGPKDLDIVSIVGMPGQGKTTLAMKVYKDPSITRYFHLLSWYCISQIYERRHLLLSILGDFTEHSEKIKEMNDEEMEEALCKSLRGRRYLVVIDDIWSIQPWDDISKSFPDDCNGSRILFTTRIREVAFKANPRTRALHDLRLFTDEESWELLQKKVFQRRNCPLELHAIGKQIAENCKGLPLSVVVIAGILTRMEEREDHWRQISESLGKQVGDSKMARDVLELSYKYLPDHLKPCFLYFGAFPEDTKIPVWKLIRLWIAEGLIQKTESESLENVAEGYLQDLIARSLVLVAKYKYNGGVKH